MLKCQQWQVSQELINQGILSYPKDQERIILNQPTGDFFYDQWAMKEEYIGTVWEKILDTLPYSIGEARVIKLIPGETYMAHADIDDRWHLNLTGEQAYLIDLDEKTMYQLKQDRHWYTMNTSRIHVAANFGSKDRLQLVVRERLTTTNKNKLISIVIEPNGSQHDYRYKFDNIISPFLNSANKKFMLKDFKFQGELVSFKLAKEELDNFNKILTKDFKVSYV